MKAFLLLLLLALPTCNLLSSQETRTFPLHHLSTAEAEALVEPYLTSERVVVKPVPGRISALTVRATGAELDEIAHVLERFDRPRPTVVLHFRLIEADGFTARDAEIADIEPVLREVFRFKGYRLIDQALIRSTTESKISQSLTARVPNEQTGNPGLYRIEALVHGLSERDGQATLQLDVQLNGSYGEAFKTSISVPTGETVVLGSTRGRAGGGAVILTVRPELQPAEGR